MLYQLPISGQYITLANVTSVISHPAEDYAKTTGILAPPPARVVVHFTNGESQIIACEDYVQAQRLRVEIATAVNEAETRSAKPEKTNSPVSPFRVAVPYELVAHANLALVAPGTVKPVSFEPWPNLWIGTGPCVDVGVSVLEQYLASANNDLGAVTTLSASTDLVVMGIVVCNNLELQFFSEDGVCHDLPDGAVFKIDPRNRWGTSATKLTLTNGLERARMPFAFYAKVMSKDAPLDHFLSVIRAELNSLNIADNTLD